ncbi:hypothetical protein FHETE_3383 [Fusarium heterosporum]|uniref:Uncharacterized protein n=1 Tax=Fusarium heterosporum TaxID=42747 RepID=A0A8H5TQR3_FUSHE|nr:hypothetical protein FHETE_3383 [Fusarium heterosporum]
MFDVIWTDPDRELVGEHRAKKEKKREQKNKEKERDQENSIIARSASATSTRSSTESRFNFLRPRNTKQAKNRGKTPSGLLTPSHNSSRSNSGSYHRSALMANLSDVSLGAARAQRAVTPASATASADASQVYPPPGSVASAIKRQEVSQSSLRPEPDDPGMSIDMRISSEADTEPPATPAGSVGDRNFSVPMLQTNSSCSLVLSTKLPKQPKAPVVINFRPNDPDSWRPPEEWEYLDRQAEKEENTKIEEDGHMVLQTNGHVQPACKDFEKLKDQVKFMAVASPTMILTRIKQIWSVTDESLHTELNMELKRWMLSILNHLDSEPMVSITDGSALIDGPVNIRVLALYEPQVTAFYLAALHPMTTVYHVSSESPPNAHFSNIQPVLVPSMSASNSSLDQHLFETVHSLSLPVVCSSPDIPQVLKQISKCLRVGGSLQLTLIDPLPCAGTLGYRMRTWLEENLLINLERHFRCTNPSKLFPDWMGDAGLRGQGSTLTTSKFYAVSTSIRSQGDGDDDDPFIDREHSEREVKAEVRSIIGRLLWMEVWGNFVTGDKWWWEDEGCVNECVQLGTIWEYHIIEGIKQDGIADEVEDLQSLEDQAPEESKA